jgi:hypothetical protein
VTGHEEIRQFVSDHLKGKHVDAILFAFGKAYEVLRDNSVAVTDQLTLSTAVGRYLDLKAGDIGLTRPSDLGMSDFSFRNLGITVTAAKQVREVIHKVMEVFYGPDSVRGRAVCSRPEPYDLEDADLTIRLEDGVDRTVVFRAEQFENIQFATAQEVANSISQQLTVLGTGAFATVETDFESGARFVKIYGAARGPYGFVQVRGGRAQQRMEFHKMRDTMLPSNTTVWQITKHDENKIRFRWDSGPEPELQNVLIGDRAIIYGAPFLNADDALVGTFDVTNVRPTQGIPSYDTGWFEVDAQVPGLRNSAPDVAPPPNTVTDTYSYTVNQVTNDDLKFYLPLKNTPYSQPRYALAFEPAPALLRVYLPATTNIVARNLSGAAHVHLLYQSTDLDGAHGHAADDALKLEVVNEFTLRYPDGRADNAGTGGTLAYGSTTVPLDRAYREGGFSYLVTAEPHGITGDDQWAASIDYSAGDEVILTGRRWRAAQNSGPSFGGAKVPSDGSAYWDDAGAARNLTSTIVTVDVDVVPQDDPDHRFLGPYAWDTEGTFTLASTRGKVRDAILEGEQKRLLYVDGAFPNQSGYLLFDLNGNAQEGPVPYLLSQRQVSDTVAPIATISRVGTLVTVTTTVPHNVVSGEQVSISGTVNFNGLHAVTAVRSPLVYNFVTGLLGDVAESVGTSTSILQGDVSLLTVDPSYRFRYPHAVGTSVSLLSSNVTYVPKLDARDLSFYVTGTADARIFCEQIVRDIAALGIKLEVVVIYPDDAGLGNAGAGTDLTKETPFSDAATFVWASSATS